MILVETDAGEWDSSIDWPALAERAVRSGVAESEYAALLQSSLLVEVSVKFASDAEVHSLNAGYRSKDKPTNVLSFPMVEPDLLSSMLKGEGEVLLGDLVLAQGVCIAEAEERGIPVQDHAAHLIVHGTLHLLGYDHETGDDDAEAMESLERKALAGLGIADPYRIDEVKPRHHA